jgi:hypothetical protein
LVRRVVDRRYNGGVDGGSPPRRSARSALIVATANYLDPGLRALRGAASDADALREVLADPAVGEFDVATVLDRPAHEVAEELEGFFADRLPGDLLLVHLSGHGIKNQTGELHFAMTNTKLDRLAATSVTAEFLNRQMGASRARSIDLVPRLLLRRGVRPRHGAAGHRVGRPRRPVLGPGPSGHHSIWRVGVRVRRRCAHARRAAAAIGVHHRDGGGALDRCGRPRP